MYSFYGGRPGNSFIIVKTFNSYEKMVTQFKKGPGYSDVHYDEHVLINTLNKLDEDNGKVYRRGYNFNADDGGAEYIGTIVGPQGNAPHLHFTNLETVEDLYENHDSESGSIVSSMDYDESETQSILPKPEMIAGKDSEGNFHDNIVWNTVSIRTTNNDITNAYIGLTIPYHIFEFTAESISEYKSAEVNRQNDEHPFFYPMHLKIPKGIHGASITDIRITTLNNESNIVIPLNLTEEEIGNRPFFACTIESYDSGKEGSGVVNHIESTKTHYFIDFYKVLDDISLNEEGILTKKYNDDSFDEINNNSPIKWIKNIELSEDGQLQVTYNTNEVSQINTQAIKWIEDIQLTDNGQLQVTYNTNDTSQINTQAIKWIEDIQLTNDGQLKVRYNTSDAQIIVNPISSNNNIQKIRWLTGVTLSDAGNLTFNWNVGEPTEFNQIKWIKDISLSDDGILSIGYNINATESTEGINLENPIKWINEMTLDNETGALKITWNTGNEQTIENVISQLTDIRINKTEDVENSEDVGKIAYQINNGNYKSIGEPINYVTDMTLDENNQVLAKFALNDDWSYLGNLTTNFQIGDQDQITESFWAGVGNVVETVNEENNQINGTLNFIISPSYYIAKNILCQMNSITLDIQQIGGQHKFSQVKIVRGSNGKVINQSQEQDDSSESSETYVNEMDEFVQAIITKTGIHFSVYLDKLNEVGWDFVGEESTQNDQQYRPVYPKTGSAKNWFCNVYVSNLSMALNRTDLTGGDEIRYFNSTREFFEYDWDSREGWNAAFTQDLFRKPSGGNTNRVINLIERNNDTNYFGDPNVSGASIINSSGRRVAQAIKISRVWGTKKNSFFVDLVRPQPLRRNGVHIVSAQVMWCDSQIPIMVYPYLPDNSSISSYREGDTDNYPINPDTYAQDFATYFPNKTLNRPTLECIKYGKGQYFRIVILDDTPGGSALVSRMYKDSNGNDQQAGLVAKTPKKLNIIVRFLYYIDHTQ